MEAETHHEEDPFSEYLSQEPVAASAPPVEEGAEALLRLVAESSQRQEQLLGKVCSLLVSLDEKMGRIAAAQERMQDNLQRLPEAAPASGATRPPPPGPTRGALVAPPGKTSYGGPVSAVPSAEEQHLAQERLLAEQKRIEEENRRRAEELARQRAEEERRRREEEERRRQEEERRREEERKAKEELGKKTSGLMSGLLSSGASGGAGGGLFGDDEPKRTSKGGLFDD
eukprot:Skav205112  [mRNA]  locus=scaffold1864:74950:85019:+ [translate_table: standard]